MPEWFLHLPHWAQNLWFLYVTFHDLIQWGIITTVGFFAWGQKKNKIKLEKELEHIHKELHQHISEDAALHEELGQTGITEGK